MQPQMQGLLLLITLLVYAEHACGLNLLSFDIHNSPSNGTALVNGVTYTPDLWSGSLPAGELHMPLLLADTNLCDGNLSDTGPVATTSPQAILVMRGDCAYSYKASIAQQLGYSLMILYNCDPTQCTQSVLPYGLDEQPNAEMQAAPLTTPNLPSIYITYPNGMMISQLISDGQSVQVYINGTGAVTVSDRAALMTIYQTFLTSAPPPYTNVPWVSGIPTGETTFSTNAAGMQQWSTLTNPQMDPCIDRLWGVWCVNGRVALLDCEYCGASGNLSDTIGDLDQLSYLSLMTSDLHGVLPETMSHLTKLNILKLDTNPSLLAVHTGWSSYHELYYLSVSYTGISSVPATISDISTLRIVDLSDNAIETLPNMSNWTQLIVLDVSNNALSALPKFNNFTELVTLSMNSNNLITTITADYFNHLQSLQSLDMGINSLQGVLPQFYMTPNLSNLVMDQNLFSGSIPSTWQKLVHLTTVSLSNNQLSGPLDYISQLPALTSLDLSYNNFTCATMSYPSNTDLGLFIFGGISQSVVAFDLSHNSIDCSAWAPGWASHHSQELSQIRLSHNRLSCSLPSDFWTSIAQYRTAVVDLSFNNLSGAFPAGVPSTLLQSLIINSNPEFGPTRQRSLPSFLEQGHDFIQPAADNGTLSTYECPMIQGVPEYKLLQANLDASYYNYTGCKCISGYEGVVPECTIFPSDLTYRQVSFDMVSDGKQSGRFRAGSDTAYVLAPNASESQAPVVAIAITFTLFDMLDSQNDIISVHSSSVSGPTVATYSEKSPPDNVTYVLGPVAVLHYTSTATTGPQFIATYKSMYQCPGNFTLDANNRCVHASAATAGLSPGVYGSLAAVGGVIVVAVAFTLWKFRNIPKQAGIQSSLELGWGTWMQPLSIVWDVFTKPLSHRYYTFDTVQTGKGRILAASYLLVGIWGCYTFAEQQPPMQTGIVNLTYVVTLFLAFAMYLAARTYEGTIPLLVQCCMGHAIGVVMLITGRVVSETQQDALIYLFVMSSLLCHFCLSCYMVLLTSMVASGLLLALHYMLAPCFTFPAISLAMSIMYAIAGLSFTAQGARRDDIRSRIVFNSKLSHEIRSPLAAIVGVLDLLHASDSLTQDDKELIQTGRMSSQDLQLRLNEFLDLAKLEVGKMDIKNKQFHLPQCINGTVAQVVASAAKRNCQLNVKLQREVPTQCLGDATRIRQCLINLLNNAIIHCESNSSIEVHVNSRTVTNRRNKDRHHVTCSVINRGRLLNAEQRNALFREFTQANNSNSKEGTGLGLVIVKQLATLMAGTAGYNSHAVGNEFWFSFTVEQGDPELLEVEVSDSFEPQMTGSLRSRELSVLPAPHPSTSTDCVQLDAEFISPLPMMERRSNSAASIKGLLGFTTMTQPPQLFDYTNRTSSASASSSTATLLPKYQAHEVRDIRDVPIQEVSPNSRSVSMSSRQQYVFPVIPAPDLSHNQNTPSGKLGIVLLVEDSLVLRKTYSRMVEKCQYQVDVAENGLLAWAMYISQPHRYNLIITDVNMPVWDGCQFSKAVRAYEKLYPQLHVRCILALTADAMEDSRPKCEQAGMQAVLTKPLSLANLQKELKKHIPDVMSSLEPSNTSGLHQHPTIAIKSSATPVSLHQQHIISEYT